MLGKLFPYFLLTLFIGFGAWVRMKGIIDGSFSFTYDVGRDMLAVEDIVVRKNPTLLGPTTGLEGLFYGPWWYYLLAIPFVFTAGNPTGVALFIAAIGVVNIILGFLLGKKMGGKFLGIVYASIMSVSPFFIHSSSQIWSPNIIPMLVLLVMFCLVRIVDRGKSFPKTWFILGLFIALIAEMEIIFGLLFAVSIVISYILFLRKHMSLKLVGFFSLGILFIEAPRILFELRHNFLMTQKIVGFLGGINTMANARIFTRENFIEMESAFYKLWSDAVAGEDHVIRVLLFVFLVFVFLIYYKKASQFEKFFLKFMVVAFAVFAFAFAVFPGGVWGHYLIGLPVLLVLTTGLSLHLLRAHFAIPAAAFVILIAIVWVNGNPIRFVIAQTMAPWQGDEAVYRNQIAIVDYIYKEANGEKFKYVLYTPPVHDYTYRYLFSWYGKKRYNSVPSGQDAKLSFFIIEPDNVFWHRRNEWIKSRRSDGKVVKEERFRWTIVQTRVPNKQ